VEVFLGFEQFVSVNQVLVLLHLIILSSVFMCGKRCRSFYVVEMLN
jgi:hypothetical protein